MKLSNSEIKVLRFLTEPRTAMDVAEHIGWQISAVYAPLRFLQRAGLVRKISEYERAKATFVATGLRVEDALEQLQSDPCITISAHDPFRLSA